MRIGVRRARRGPALGVRDEPQSAWISRDLQTAAAPLRSPLRSPWMMPHLGSGATEVMGFFSIEKVNFYTRYHYISLYHFKLLLEGAWGDRDETDSLTEHLDSPKLLRHRITCDVSRRPRSPCGAVARRRRKDVRAEICADPCCSRCCVPCTTEGSRGPRRLGEIRRRS
jgi:hypothetical protein